MGRILTLIFLLTAYIGPEKVFGSLVQYHVQIVIGIFALLTSLPNALNRFEMRVPQVVAMFGLVGAVFISLIANRWFSGALFALDMFVPQVIPFFLVLLNFHTKRHIQQLVAVLLVASFFVIYSGNRDLKLRNADSPYLLAQNNDKGESFFRLRGEQFMGDPNDFAQLLVCLIPLAFVFWAKRRRFGNLLLVYLPIAILIFGMYLTHSRGGVVAILALLLMGGRKRVGKIGSAILAALAFAGTTAIGWTGGRDISVEAGAGRMDAWAEGLQLIQTHPLFGVGYNRFTEFYFITAHNTIVVCAAELGVFGFFFWVLFVIPSVLNSWNIANTSQVQALETKSEEVVKPEWATVSHSAGMHSLETYSSLDPTPGSQLAVHPHQAEIRRLGEVMLLTMTCFLVSGWFLSRSYVMTLFIIGAMTEVVFNLAIDSGVVTERMNWNRLLKITAVGTIALLILVYVVLRISNLAR